MKFIQSVIPDLKKDLLKDGIKYLITALLSTLVLWLAGKISFWDKALHQSSGLSWLQVSMYFTLTIIICSFVSFRIYNIRYHRLQREMLRDDQTGLLNHKALPIKLKEAVAAAKKGKKALSVILIGVDNFKDINAKWNSRGGDQVIKQLGAYLSNDARAADFVCRKQIKDDKFVIIAINTNSEQGRMAAERKRNEIAENEFQVDWSGLVKITVSCGIATYLEESDTPDVLIGKAEKALQLAKQLGKNRSINYHEPADENR